MPWSIANASFKKQKRNAAVTEIVKIPGRGHALTIDQRLAGGRPDGARVREARYVVGRRRRGRI